MEIEQIIVLNFQKRWFTEFSDLWKWLLNNIIIKLSKFRFLDAKIIHDFVISVGFKLLLTKYNIMLAKNNNEIMKVKIVLKSIFINWVEKLCKDNNISRFLKPKIN